MLFLLVLWFYDQSKIIFTTLKNVIKFHFLKWRLVNSKCTSFKKPRCSAYFLPFPFLSFEWLIEYSVDAATMVVTNSSLPSLSEIIFLNELFRMLHHIFFKNWKYVYTQCLKIEMEIEKLNSISWQV